MAENKESFGEKLLRMAPLPAVVLIMLGAAAYDEKKKRERAREFYDPRGSDPIFDDVRFRQPRAYLDEDFDEDLYGDGR